MSDALAEVLSNTINNDATIRKTAEIELSRALDKPEIGPALIQILLDSDKKLVLRQIALRRFVETQWSPQFPLFKGPHGTPVEIKAQMRPAIFAGLTDPKRQIRSLCAALISSISSADWPDEYPSLLQDLLALLQTEQPDSIHGAMEVFTEFVQNELTEEQLLPVLRQLLPVLMVILGKTEQYSPLTRSRTVFVFSQGVSALYMVKGEHGQAVKEATAAILPVWLEGFQVLLMIDSTSDIQPNNWDGLRLRKQIYEALSEIYTSFPRMLAPYLNQFLTASLKHFHSLFPTMEQYYLISSSDIAPSSPEDGHEHALAELLVAIMDFIGQAARGSKARAWFDDEHFNDLVAFLYKYTQMTDDDVEQWADDPNAFAAQEEELLKSLSMRMIGFDLFGSLMIFDSLKTTEIMQSNLLTVIQASEQARINGNPQWWRSLEAAMACISSQASAIQDLIDDENDNGRPSPINIEHILTEVIPSVLNLSEFPFLQGRGFIFVSQFAKLLPLQLSGLYLDAAIKALEATTSAIPVKVSAVRAIQNFTQKASDETMRPYAERIVKDLGPFLIETSEDTFLLILETLSLVLNIDSATWLSPDLAGQVMDALMEVYTNTKKADAMTMAVMVDTFDNLSGANSPGVYETVVGKALPRLCEIVGNSRPSDFWVSSTSVELIESLASGAPGGKLGDGFFAMAAPALFKSIADAEDRDLIQNIISCLTMMIRKDPDQILSWSDGGRSSLEHIFAVIAKLLNSEEESGGLNMGDLIIQLIRKAGQSVFPVLPELLQAMVKRMSIAQTATFTQSLLIPFAYLINNQRDSVLDLLEGLNVDTRSGLDVFIQTFCENAEMVQGDWANRQTVMALVELYKAASTGRASLANMAVKGDMIIKPEMKNIIMTRGRAKQNPPEFTRISFPMKAIKLLLKEFESSNEAMLYGSIKEMTSSDGGDDEEDEDWEDEESFVPPELQYLSEMLGPRGLPGDNDDILDSGTGLFAIREDDDLRSDTIMTVDMDGYIKAFFKQCHAENGEGFKQEGDTLNVEEMAKMQTLLA